MKRLATIILIALSTITTSYAQNNVQSQNQFQMKLNAGIITEKIQETKQFYTENLGFGVTFENEFYLLMHTPGHQAQLSFLLPDHPSQQPLFQSKFQGEGAYLTIEVQDVDELYHQLKEKGVQIKIDIRDEPWGDRHFAIQDPNGVGIDLVKYTGPAN
ncbi:MAG: VOC family protein [Reichenbachiella sp.]|uniref:VOC family protein n=1 Tax=Reichenbachiella sp. TaxID=2184521 RepID=UPI0032998DC4